MFITTAWDLEGFEHEILRAQLKIKRFGRIVRVTKTFVVKDTEVERSLPLCSNKHTHSVSAGRVHLHTQKNDTRVHTRKQPTLARLDSHPIVVQCRGEQELSDQHAATARRREMKWQPLN